MSDDQGISVSYNAATGQISSSVLPKTEQKTLHPSFQMAATGTSDASPTPTGHIAAYANLGQKTVIQNTIEWMLENPNKIVALNLPDLNTADPNHALNGEGSPRIADILSIRDTLGQSTFDVLTGVAMQGAKAFLINMLVKQAMTQILDASVNLNIGDHPVTLTAGGISIRGAMLGTNITAFRAEIRKQKISQINTMLKKAFL
ncbi:MAG: hypothetical protein R3D66_00820 [Alphaproteobacteria bacterium]